MFTGMRSQSNLQILGSPCLYVMYRINAMSFPAIVWAYVSPGNYNREEYGHLVFWSKCAISLAVCCWLLRLLFELSVPASAFLLIIVMLACHDQEFLLGLEHSTQRTP